MRGAHLRGLLVLVMALLPALAGGSEDSIDSILFDGDGRRLTVRVSTAFTPPVQAGLLDWTRHIAATLEQVYGHWPLQQWQIAIAPADSASNLDPIPWAQVFREKVTRVQFYIARNTTPDALRQAWTGYHELAHLLIPYRGWGDAWFSEGLASYYQNIMQARAGVIDEQQMWQKLYEGFQRGIADSGSADQPLAAVSDNMRQNGNFMRVYWSGAWYFLAADTRLRLQSGGQHSLDQALAALNSCCAEKHLSVPEIVNQLDQLNRVVLFGTLYGEVAASTRVPPFDNLFASLGIDIIDGQVRLQQSGPGARLRRQIAAGTNL